MPSARFHYEFANDVFISYTHEDDHEDAGIRWVTRFEDELRSRLAKVSGQSITIWRDSRLTGADRFTPEIEAQLLGSAVLVAVITPSYFNSEWCTAERTKFIERARALRGLDVGNRARIVKAAKTRVTRDKYPQELRELLEFTFYVNEKDKPPREFHLSPDPMVRRQLHTVVDDMAQAITEILKGLEGGTPRSSKGFVYLGETSSDVDEARAQLRRGLVHRGYDVLPAAPLRLRTGPEAERLVARDLAQSRLAVYPVGAYYGPVLEGSEGRSITELQLAMATADQRNGALTRMVWVPQGLQVSEQKQQDLLVRIRTEYPARGFEIIESRLAEIETHVTDRLEPPKPVEESADEPAAEREIYLLCLPEDRPAARAVADHLFNEGFEVRLPPTNDKGFASLHERRLASADAFVVIWGTGDESWLEPVITDLKRAKGLRQGKPILGRAIVLVDEPTTEKDDYRTRAATILRGYSSVKLGDALEPLVAELRRGRTSSDGGSV